ncbi:hypothetical protein ACJ73_02720 [Blastomyces percursus]|uniref:Uncharacterized protein n=1 Tax=Blastomyces percursus TaxID=1658174 RepID=A0A1J9RBL8_9EURO|nr:hypothetical protein ACJ73_02720 [Blastomyces percursus]
MNPSLNQTPYLFPGYLEYDVAAQSRGSENYPSRRTEDVDLVIHVDQRMITSACLTTNLLSSFPSDFDGINQFGHTIPAYKLHRPGGTVQLVELEVFDCQSWPQRPQYNILVATRKTLTINGRRVTLFGSEWILREKILSQCERQSGAKEVSDIHNIMSMIPLAVPGRPELDFIQSQDLQTALANLVQKRPFLVQALKAKIKCSTIFQN